ncbi:WbqC family protein [uncultured Desulfobacter sp.]|uniref:WbqC family protein n=1 Tax=uncultured Desulfobacter sp. TaxID=240139 RepID=UPI0029F46AD8|nr:WbqC family protein [uncultured Desulfobacter sp.]
MNHLKKQLSSSPCRLAIQQPEHAPWLGFFHKMMHVDIYVYLDNVQFKKRYFENRNKIRTPDGWIWTTAPVIVKGRYTQNIRDVELTPDHGWKRSYAGRLHSSYGKSTGSPELLHWLQETWLPTPHCLLLDMNLSFINYIRNLLFIDTPTLLASDLTSAKLRGSDLILNICRRTGANIYISGPDGRNYLDQEAFSSAGVKIKYHDFKPPVYPQMHPGPFLSHMSISDALFNIGPAATRKMLKEIS